MGLHQDKDERALSAPVVSVSLGDEALFRIGGQTRRGADPKRVSVFRRCGDVRRTGAAGLSRHRPHPGRQFFAGSRRRPHQSHPETRHASGIKKRPAEQPPARSASGGATIKKRPAGATAGEATASAKRSSSGSVAMTRCDHKKTPGWGNSRALNAPLRARMPGGDNRHPRKIGSGVRAGGQSLPDQNYLPRTTYAAKPHFSSFFVPGLLYK